MSVLQGLALAGRQLIGGGSWRRRIAGQSQQTGFATGSRSCQLALHRRFDAPRKDAIGCLGLLPTLEKYFHAQESGSGVSRYFVGGSSHPPQPTPGLRAISLSIRSAASF